MSMVNSRKVVNLLVKNHIILYTAVRNHWNKDYKPLPFPKTQEERNRAAEKYGLLPSEYKPFPDDGTGLGDYPDIPAESADSRDPFYPWDNPELRRNFNELLHRDTDMIGEDRYDVSAKHRVAPWLQWAQFIGALALFGSVYLILEQCKMFPGVVPKQYPLTGKTHYTFETEK